MRLSICLHLRGLSLSDTVSVLESFGVNRARSTVHNWVQKVELQPTTGRNPDHVAIDETVIQLTDQRYWLYAAVDPHTNEFLHLRLFPTQNTAVTSIFLSELIKKHDVKDAMFLVDSAPWLQAALHRHGFQFRYERHGNRDAVERLFQEIKGRTLSFSNCLSNARAETADQRFKVSPSHRTSLSEHDQ